MERPNLKYVTGIITAAAMLFGAASSAQAADDIVSAVDCCTFAGGPFSQAAGEKPLFVNPQGSGFVPHNVTANSKGPDGNPLFESDTISEGETSPVEGAQYLSAGTYPFVCTIHPPGMRGELIVAGGTALPRPKIAFSIPSQKLKQVRKTGKVKVKVKALTAASSIKLDVLKGKLKAGSTTIKSLAKGASRTIAVKLTKKGKKAIRKGKKVPLSGKATVAFGKSASARRTLR